MDSRNEKRSEFFGEKIGVFVFFDDFVKFYKFKGQRAAKAALLYLRIWISENMIIRELQDEILA